MLSAVEKKSDQVYRWLLAYIDENKFSGNQRLPSENALCRKLGVSRETIRVAIDQLVAEGLVQAQGKWDLFPPGKSNDAGFEHR